MNTKSNSRSDMFFFVLVLVIIFLISSLYSAGTNTITYQGTVTTSGGTAPANGNYAMRFSLWNVVSGGTPATNQKWQETRTSANAVAITNGAFSVELGSVTAFPTNFFSDYPNLWLEVEVDLTGTSGSSFQVYSPRVAFTASAYSFQSDNTDKLNGYSSGDFALTSHNHDTSYWKLNGNTGTTPGTNYFGTSDNQAMEMRVNNVRALRLEPTSYGANIVEGYSGNTVTSGAYSSSIGGGGASGVTNKVTDNYGTVSGGANNRAGDNAGTTSDKQYATVGGGYGNIASGPASTIPGGYLNSTTGAYSLSAGRRAKAEHMGAFVWGDSQDSDFTSTGTNQFLVRALGGVGINTNNPGSYALRVNGTAEFTDTLSMVNKKIMNVADPTNAQDAANKVYVDSAVSGVSTVSVEFVDADGALSTDGVSLIKSLSSPLNLTLADATQGTIKKVKQYQGLTGSILTINSDKDIKLLSTDSFLELVYTTAEGWIPLCANMIYIVLSEEQKIMASDAQANDEFGVSVSVSCDGNTAIVGAYYEDTGGNNAGAAYVFVVMSVGVWSEQQKLTASDAEAGDIFGCSVSLSSDGNTAIVGAYGEDAGGNNAGAAYVFVRSGGVWSEQQKLTASDAQADDWFGYSVSLSSDGNTAIVGAPYEDTGGSDAGASYVFVRSGVVWSEQQKLTASDAQAYDHFGISVSLSSDGNTAIVGAYLEDAGGSNAGAAYVFVRSGVVWSEQQKFTASDAQADDYFGYSVSLSSDGNTAIVGAYYEDTGGGNAGAAYVFVRSGGVWSQQQKLTASDAEASDYFGYSVSLSGDGNTAIVGAPCEDTGGSDSGAAYIFH